MFFPQFLPNTEAEDKKQQSNTQSCNGNRIAENKNSGLQIVRGRNEVDSLLLKTISDLDSEREGSVKKLTTALKDDPKINQRDILLFYLENLPKLKGKNNEHGIWNATLISLEGSVLEKEKGRIGKFYQEIYN